MAIRKVKRLKRNADFDNLLKIKNKFMIEGNL